MHKIPFEVLIHSENALIEVPEGGEDHSSLMFAAVQTLLTPVIDELNKAMAIHENNKAPHTGE